jgi:hypothetical protein
MADVGSAERAKVFTPCSHDSDDFGERNTITARATLRQNPRAREGRGLSSTCGENISRALCGHSKSDSPKPLKSLSCDPKTDSDSSLRTIQSQGFSAKNESESLTHGKAAGFLQRRLLIFCTFSRDASGPSQKASAFGAQTPLFRLDSLGIYGTEIWRLYAHFFRENDLHTVAALRATQLGISVRTNFERRGGPGRTRTSNQAVMSRWL